MPQKYDYGALAATPPYDYGSLATTPPPTPADKQYDYGALAASPPGTGLELTQPSGVERLEPPRIGQRGMPPRAAVPESSMRGAPPPVNARPLPAERTAPLSQAQSPVDRFLDLLPNLPPSFKKLTTPEGQALGDAVRGLTTPENLAIMGGIGAANLVPGVGAAVDVGAAAYFAKQMLEAGIAAEADLQAAQGQANQARAKGDKVAAAQFDEKVRYARAQKLISSTLAVFLGKGGGKKVLEAATAHITETPRLTPEQVRARVQADVAQPKARAAPEAAPPAEPHTIAPEEVSFTPAEVQSKPPEAPAQAESPRVSTVATFHEDTTALKTHPARPPQAEPGTPEYANFEGRVRKHGASAPPEQLADYIAQLRKTAELHAPDNTAIMEHIETAEDNLQAGVPGEAAWQAELARGAGGGLSTEYQMRAATEALDSATALQDAETTRRTEAAKVQQEQEAAQAKAVADRRAAILAEAEQAKVKQSPPPEESKPKAVPPWVQDDINAKFAEAATRGIVADIERLAAERLTADQIVTRLGPRIGERTAAKGIIRAVRSKLGIPSMDATAEFEAWVKNRAPQEAPLAKRPRVSKKAATADEVPSAPKKPTKAKAIPAERPRTAPDTPERLIEESAHTDMQAWADNVRHAQEQLSHRRGESSYTTESNAAGKEIEEAADLKSRSIRSLGAKEGTVLAKFPETPGMLATAIDKGKGKLFERIRTAFEQSTDEAHGETIRRQHSGEPPPDALMSAIERVARRIHGDDKYALTSPVNVRDLRAEFPGVSKEAFDRAVYRLAEEGKTWMNPQEARLPDAAEQATATVARLASEGPGKDYVGVQLREAPPEDALEEALPDTPPPAVEIPDAREPDLSSRLDRRLEEARAKVKKATTDLAKGSSLQAGLPTDLLAAYAELGALHIAKGAVDFAVFSKRMMEDVGEHIKPHLKAIYQLSQETLAKNRAPISESVEAASQKYGPLGGVRRSIEDTYRKTRDYVTIDPVPALTRAKAVMEAVSHAYARIAVPRMVNDYLSQVFPQTYKNIDAMRKVIRIMNLDNILGGYDELKVRAATASAEGHTVRARNLKKLIENIEERHDLGEYDTAVRQAEGNPEIAGAIDRWKKIVNPVLDALYNEMKGMDPETPREGRGRVFGARVNLLAEEHVPAWLKAVTENENAMPETPPSSSSLMTYRNPDVRADRFDRMARFNAEKYSDDPVAVLANVIGPRWNEVTKRRLYNKLVQEGWAMWDHRPESGTIHGEEVRAADVKIPQTEVDEEGNAVSRTKMVTRQLWLPKSLHEEFRAVLGTDLPLQQNIVGRTLTKIQVAQLADATSHLKNILSVLSSAIGMKTLWRDVGRKMPGISSVDSLARIGDVMYEMSQDTPESRHEIAEMAKAGQIRQHFAPTGIQKLIGMQKLIHNVDTASRIVMNRFYDNMVERGTAVDTPAARRAYVQQIGEYNKRLMGPLMRGASQSGLSPFIVAGRTFNRFSKRLLVGSPGFTPASSGAAIRARLVNLTTLGSMFVLPAMINYLSQGSIYGRPGTPIGAIDLSGKEDASGKHKVLDLLQLYGVRRGMRATGVQSIAEGLQNGDSADDIVGGAIMDSFSTAAHPWLGPGAAFVAQAATGSRLDLRGGPMPVQAAKMEGRGSQLLENTRVAAKNQNLMLYSPLRMAFSDVDTSPIRDFAKDFLKAPASAVGISDRVSPAIQAARDAALHIQTTPEQKQRSQVRRQILAAYDAGDNAKAADLKEKAMAAKLINPGDISEISRERDMEPLERAAWREPLETIVNIWSKASPAEKPALRRLLTRKLSNARPDTAGIDRARAILRGPD